MTPDKPFKGYELEWIVFVIMNLSAPPAELLVCGIIWGWIGAIASVVIFIILFQVWKRIGGYQGGKLIFSPSFTFGKKTWRV